MVGTAWKQHYILCSTVTLMRDGDQENQFDLFDDGPSDSEDSGPMELSDMQDAGMSELYVKAEQQAVEVAEKQSIKGSYNDPTLAEAYGIKDLIKRAQFIQRNNAFDLPEYTPTKEGVRFEGTSDINRFVVWDKMFDRGSGVVPFPYYDTFSQTYYGHDDKPLKTPAIREYMEVLAKAHMKLQKTVTVEASIKEWSSSKERNSLIHRMCHVMPKWDGVERLETKIIEWLKPFDTPTTRKVSKYFWLSLYGRVMFPGIEAPISLAFIGHQGVGKSHFSKIICEQITGTPESAPIKLNLHQTDQTAFLRKITGTSVIANIGELVGFNRADMDVVKDFLSSGHDTFDRKYQEPRQVQRQWITILDGNRYEGVNRDETGNRRIYPIFAFQEPDENGKPSWSKENGIRAEYEDGDGFEYNFWQMMAECKAFFDEHGKKGYFDFLKECSDAVAEYNGAAMKAGAGTVKDNDTETWMRPILLVADFDVKRAAKKGGVKRVAISAAQIQYLAKKSGGKQMTSPAIKRFLDTLGFEPAIQGGVEYRLDGSVFGLVGEAPEEQIVFMFKKWLLSKFEGEELSDKEVAAAIGKARLLFDNLPNKDF